MTNALVIVPLSWSNFTEQLTPLLTSDVEMQFGFTPATAKNISTISRLGLCCESIQDLNLLQTLDQVKVVSFTGTGITDVLELPILEHRNLTICNIRDYASVEVAEHTFALIFGVAKRICFGDALVRRGQWFTNAPWGVTLRGKTLGLLGLGSIGCEVARIGRMLGMKVVYWSRSARDDVELELGIEFVDIENLFSTSDVVSLHLSLNAATRGIVGRSLLQRLSTGAILVNTARGGLVDQDALLEALTSGKLAAAALDVFENEPLPKGHALTKLENVIFSPHVGALTSEAIMRSKVECLINVVSFFNGVPRNVVKS